MFLHEGIRNAEFLTYEADHAFTREAVLIDSTAAAISAGTVVVNGQGEFVGIVKDNVSKGYNKKQTLIVRGPALVIPALLTFPSAAAVTNATDGPDAGSDTVAENAAATAAASAALRTALLEQMAAKLIIARN
jgi:hypothetical protein